MKNKIEKFKEEILSKLSEVKDGGVLRELEIKILGRKGELAGILKDVAKLTDEEKKEAGKLANELKSEIRKKFEEAKEIFESAAKKPGFSDPTLPGGKIARGHLHPITIVREDLEDFFRGLNFMVLEGPELESDYFCFEALNIPKWHPARDMQDTFYIDPKGLNVKGEEGGAPDLVMRTHTSPMQVRSMLKYGPPLRCVVPGRCFRSEATDVRHEHTFYQLEGLMVDKNINIRHLKGILEAMAKHLYGPETEVRLRPKFYPFVEPGFNGEVTCFLCHGQGCRLCKQTGWLEIFGAGMVHPNVLKAGKIDPEKYTGFAFGFGLNRIVQLKYGIEDIRLFNSGDLRFLEQF
ncbi:MAG: phenylalanine--tRNA ligase subunit alpha [Patescibacteria group bacterium]|jgi:phenylalanyl-tRNA synthetase alpha chain